MSKCQQVIKSGKNSGKICGAKANYDGCCYKHRKSCQESCKVILKSGKRKGQPCGAPSKFKSCCLRHKSQCNDSIMTQIQDYLERYPDFSFELEDLLEREEDEAEQIFSQLKKKIDDYNTPLSVEVKGKLKSEFMKKMKPLEHVDKYLKVGHQLVELNGKNPVFTIEFIQKKSKVKPNSNTQYVIHPDEFKNMEEKIDFVNQFNGNLIVFDLEKGHLMRIFDKIVKPSAY